MERKSWETRIFEVQKGLWDRMRIGPSFTDILTAPTALNSPLSAFVPSMDTSPSSDLYWFVAHVRPRCEKKLAEFCQREGFEFSLPLYRSLKRYRGKKVEFRKPLFPGYVFLRILPESAPKLRQNQHVANLLEPPDQAEFNQQLGDILQALDTEIEIQLAPQIVEGQRVRIKHGPLRGLAPSPGFHRPGRRAPHDRRRTGAGMTWEGNPG